MDKAQKQLIDTYYRKRNLAAEEDGYRNFEKYEIRFGLKNKSIIIDDLNETEYYNYLWGTDYEKISKFGQYGGDVALAQDENYNYFFLNKQGKSDLTGVNPNKIDDEDVRILYCNKLWGTDIYYMTKFGQYGGDSSYTKNNEGSHLFLNRKGKPDLTGIDPNKIYDEDARDGYDYTILYIELYFNKLWGTDYKGLGKFGIYGKGISLAYDKNYNKFFVNIQGKPNLIGIDYDKIYSNSERKAYNNTKNMISD